MRCENHGPVGLDEYREAIEKLLRRAVVYTKALYEDGVLRVPMWCSEAERIMRPCTLRTWEPKAAKAPAHKAAKAVKRGCKRN